MSRSNLLVVLIGVALAHTPSDGAEPELQAALTQLQMTLGRLKSVEYKAECKYHSILQDGSSVDVSYEIEFAMQGPKFYSRVKTRNEATDKTLDATHAFDGDLFQQLDEPDLILRVGTAGFKSSYFMLQPLVYPMSFVYRDKAELNYSTLLGRQTWTDLAENATVERDATVEGHQCTILNVRKEVDGAWVKATVFLDNDRGNYPVKITSTGSDYRSELIVDGFAEITGDSGELYVPTHILDKAFDSTGKERFVMEMSITPGTVSMNEELPLTRFRIPKSRARIYDDVDARLAGTGRPVWLKTKSDNRSFGIRKVVLGITLLASIVIAVRLTFNARKTK
jgi:hypothetical protein